METARPADIQRHGGDAKPRPGQRHRQQHALAFVQCLSQPHLAAGHRYRPGRADGGDITPRRAFDIV